jgi:hypothetical protein
LKWIRHLHGSISVFVVGVKIGDIQQMGSLLIKLNSSLPIGYVTPSGNFLVGKLDDPWSGSLIRGVLFMVGFVNNIAVYSSLIACPTID